MFHWDSLHGAVVWADPLHHRAFNQMDLQGGELSIINLVLVVLLYNCGGKGFGGHSKNWHTPGYLTINWFGWGYMKGLKDLKFIACCFLRRFLYIPTLVIFQERVKLLADFDWPASKKRNPGQIDTLELDILFGTWLVFTVQQNKS